MARYVKIKLFSRDKITVRLKELYVSAVDASGEYTSVSMGWGIDAPGTWADGLYVIHYDDLVFSTEAEKEHFKMLYPDWEE